MTAYRRRPVVVEAIQWTGDNLDDVRAWLGDIEHLETWPDKYLWAVLVDDQQVVAPPTDYLVRDERGVVSRKSSEEFDRDYESIKD